MKRWIALLVVVLACGDDDSPNDAGTDAQTDAVVDAPPDVPADTFDAGPTIVLPDELADEEALARFGLAGLPILGEALYRQQSSEDRETGDPVPLDLLENGNRDLNNFVCRGEVADFRGPFVPELIFDEEVCPEPYARGFVVARFEGSGALVRYFMTALSIRTGEFDRERLLIWVDDEPDLVVDVPLAGVVDGSAGEVFAPPFGAGAPSWISWHYPVVFGSKLLVAIDGLGTLDGYYHQTSVQLDREPRARTRADTRLPARDDAVAALSAFADADRTESTMVDLGSDETTTAFDLTGPATVRVVRLETDDLAGLEGVTISMAWDGETTIDVPILELFAAALDEPPFDLELRFPMPFATSAQVTLTSSTSDPPALTLTMELEDGAESTHLHVIRSETLGPTTGRHPIVSLGERGRLAGVCMLLEGHALDGEGITSSPLNFLEGDERGIVDGFHALRGTGTEDYLDSSFYFEDGPFATPWAVAFGIETEDRSGRVSSCRFHVHGDEVDFAESLELDLEIGPGHPELLDRYRTLAFVYLE